jgi:hypothetical protein
MGDHFSQIISNNNDDNIEYINNENSINREILILDSQPDIHTEN